MPRFNLDEYVTVQERITKFWTDHPHGRIETEVVAITPNHKDVVVKASVFPSEESTLPLATGLAQETQGGPSANAASWVENAETSAIGRALANLDYTRTKDGRRAKRCKRSTSITIALAILRPLRSRQCRPSAHRPRRRSINRRNRRRPTTS